MNLNPSMKIAFKSILLICLISLLSCNSKSIQRSTQTCSPLLPRGVLAQRKEEPLFRIVQNRKWGFIANIGQMMIKPQFNYAEDFSEGLAAFKSGGKWGFIDRTGKVVIKPQFEEVRDFLEGRAAFKSSNKWGFIDTTGRVIIAPQFDEVRLFFEGRAAVRKDGKWGFIDRDGNYVTEIVFSGVNNFSEGLAAFSLNNNDGRQQGFIDKNGKIIIALKDLSIDLEDSRFSNGLVKVYVASPWSRLLKEIPTGRQQKLWGFIDKNGIKVIPVKYDSVLSFSECLASVKVKDKYGVINSQGKIVMKPQFDFIGPFDGGIARVRVNQKYGYINKTGRIFIEPQFNDASNQFSEGLAAVQLEKDGKWGAVDRTGKIIIEPQFEKHFRFINGLAKVTVDEKWGYIDRSDKYVWGPTLEAL